MIIVDIDNTISDARWRNEYAERKEWDIYHSLSIHDKPINLHILEEDDSIFFLTGRPEKYRDITLKWMDKHLPKKTRYKVIMRPESDFASAPKFKASIASYFNKITFAWDDREDVLEAYRKLGIPCGNPNSKRAPASILEQGATTFNERNALYADNYLLFGGVMAALLPNGVQINSAENWNKFGLLIQCVSKLTRFCNSPDMTHRDSVHDLMVYAAMLESIIGD